MSSWARLRTVLDSDLSPRARLVATALLRRCGKDHVCYPSISDLEDQTGYSRSTVFRGIEELEDRGWLERQQRRRKASRYVLKIKPSQYETTRSKPSHNETVRPCKPSQYDTAKIKPSQYEIKPSQYEITPPHPPYKEKTPKKTPNESARTGTREADIDTSLFGPDEIPDPPPDLVTVPEKRPSSYGHVRVRKSGVTQSEWSDLRTLMQQLTDQDVDRWFSDYLSAFSSKTEKLTEAKRKTIRFFWAWFGEEAWFRVPENMARNDFVQKNGKHLLSAWPFNRVDSMEPFTLPQNHGQSDGQNAMPTRFDFV